MPLGPGEVLLLEAGAMESMSLALTKERGDCLAEVLKLPLTNRMNEAWDLIQVWSLGSCMSETARSWAGLGSVQAMRRRVWMSIAGIECS